MKWIFTKKKLQGEIDKNCNDLKKEIEDLKTFINNKEFRYLEERDKYIDKCKKLEETNRYHQQIIQLRDADIARLSKKLRQANGARGGFVARINELIKQVDEINEKFDKYKAEKEIEIADLKSDRYLRVTPPTKNRMSKQKMSIYTTRTSKNSEIIRKAKINEK